MSVDLSPCMPLTLVSPKRLDLMCKYRFFRELKNGYIQPATQDFYIRHILARTGGIEPTDIFGQEQNKKNIQDYIQSAVDLFVSLSKNGFLKDSPIPYYSDKQLGNGAHRLAASLALDIPIYCELTEMENRPPLWDFQWFVEKGFSLKEQMALLYDYVQLKPDTTSVFVYYAPAEEHWAEFDDVIKSNFDVVGAINIALPTDISMYELLQDIYVNLDSHDANTAINRKSRILSAAPLKLRVVLGEKKSHIEKSTEELATLTKNKCRDLADNTVAKNTFLSIHASEGSEETLLLSSILFSHNNLLHLAARKHFPIRPVFLQWITYCKETCKQNGIAIQDICVVGSSPLEVIGVRQSTDIDFTLKNHYRVERYGDGITHLNDNNDIVTKGYHRLASGHAFSDDELIDYPDLHFIFRGLKFANPKIILERKNFSRREKDVNDLRLYQEYKQKPFAAISGKTDYPTAYQQELIIRNKS